MNYKTPIHNALLLYGHSNFSLEILEICEKHDTISREQYYLDLLKPDYNILQQAGSSLGYLHNEETLAKMSSSRTREKHPMFGKLHSEETRAKMSATSKGRTQNEETRAKISSSKTGQNLSDEIRKKISEALKGNQNASKGLGRQRPDGAGSPSVQIKVLDMKTGIKTVYSSMSETAKALGVPSGSIRMYFSRNTHKLYKERYLLQKNEPAKK